MEGAQRMQPGYSPARRLLSHQRSWKKGRNLKKAPFPCIIWPRNHSEAGGKELHEGLQEGGRRPR